MTEEQSLHVKSPSCQSIMSLITKYLRYGLTYNITIGLPFPLDINPPYLTVMPEMIRSVTRWSVVDIKITGFCCNKKYHKSICKIFICVHHWQHLSCVETIALYIFTGDPLHSRALAHSRAPLFTQPCPHCSHSRAPGEQWARPCVFTLQGCVQAARLCRGSPVILICK